MAYYPELPFNSVCQSIAASNNIMSQIVTYLGWPTYPGTIPLNHLIDHSIIKISHIAKVSWLETWPTEYAISANSASPNYGGSLRRLSRWVAWPRNEPKELRDSMSESRYSQCWLQAELNVKAKELKPICVIPVCPSRQDTEGQRKRKGKKN